MEKLSKFSLALVIILCIFILFLIGIIAKLKQIGPFKTTYQVVALKDGSVYFGRLSIFPFPKLKDVWFVRQEPSPEKNQEPNLMLYPISTLYFGPENVLYLQKENILWWADLSEGSEVLNLIKARRASPPQPIPASPGAEKQK